MLRKMCWTSACLKNLNEKSYFLYFSPYVEPPTLSYFAFVLMFWKMCLELSSPWIVFFLPPLMNGKNIYKKKTLRCLNHLQSLTVLLFLLFTPYKSKGELTNQGISMIKCNNNTALHSEWLLKTTSNNKPFGVFSLPKNKTKLRSKKK